MLYFTPEAIYSSIFPSVLNKLWFKDTSFLIKQYNDCRKYFKSVCNVEIYIYIWGKILSLFWFVNDKSVSISNSNYDIALWYISHFHADDNQIIIHFSTVLTTLNALIQKIVGARDLLRNDTYQMTIFFCFETWFAHKKGDEQCQGLWGMGEIATSCYNGVQVSLLDNYI